MLIVGIYKLRYSSLLKLERSQAKSRHIAIFGLSSRKAPRKSLTNLKKKTHPNLSVRLYIYLHNIKQKLIKIMDPSLPPTDRISRYNRPTVMTGLRFKID